MTNLIKKYNGQVYHGALFNQTRNSSLNLLNLLLSIDKRSPSRSRRRKSLPCLTLNWILNIITTKYSPLNLIKTMDNTSLSLTKGPSSLLLHGIFMRKGTQVFCRKNIMMDYILAQEVLKTKNFMINIKIRFYFGFMDIRTTQSSLLVVKSLIRENFQIII